MFQLLAIYRDGHFVGDFLVFWAFRLIICDIQLIFRFAAIDGKFAGSNQRVRLKTVVFYHFDVHCGIDFYLKGSSTEFRIGLKLR